MKPTPDQIQSAKRMPSFILEMRNAIRDGRKTQTRRVMNPQPWNDNEYKLSPEGIKKFFDRGSGDWWGVPSNVEPSDPSPYSLFEIKCPYGKEKDIQYLCEPLTMIDDLVSKKKWAYYADTLSPVYVNDEPLRWKWKVKTLSARYMPKIAARTFCVRTETKVERVQSISQADAIAEGTCGVANTRWGTMNFRHLWDHINYERGFGWNTNPWVWCIGFQLLKK